MRTLFTTSNGEDNYLKEKFQVPPVRIRSRAVIVIAVIIIVIIKISIYRWVGTVVCAGFSGISSRSGRCDTRGRC